MLDTAEQILKKYKPHLDFTILNYLVKLKKHNVIILYEQAKNYFSLPNILKYNIYISDVDLEKLLQNNFMLILNRQEFKNILLKNGFTTYYELVDLIKNYNN